MRLGAVFLVCLCFLTLSDLNPAMAVPLKTDAVGSTDGGLMKKINNRIKNERTKRAEANAAADLDEKQILKRLYKLIELTKRRRRRHRCKDC